MLRARPSQGTFLFLSTQRGASLDDGAIVPGEWNHVGLNYDSGALLEVWLNSSRVDVAGMFGTLECQTAAMSHIDNREPWALGVSAMTSNSGSVEPPAGPLTGAIDHLRIHGAKRDFSGPEYRVGPP